MRKQLINTNLVTFMLEFEQHVKDGWTLVTTGLDSPNIAFGTIASCTVEKEDSATQQLKEELNKPEKRSGRPPKAKD